jgi:membrane protease YdiL (CAAX protease family)
MEARFEVELSALTPYLALATFPVATILASFSNVVELSWGFHHGLAPKPTEVRDKSDAITRYANFLKCALVLGFIAFLAERNSLPAARLGLHLHKWKTNMLLGMTALAVYLLWQSLVSNSLRYENQFTREVRRGSIRLWVCIFFVGAFSEELWIAFCLVTLIATGYSTPVSIAFVTVVFAAMHGQYYIHPDRPSWAFRLGAVLGIGSKSVASSLLFLWTGSLITTFPFHFIGNLGSLYWSRRSWNESPRSGFLHGAS